MSCLVSGRPTLRSNCSRVVSSVDSGIQEATRARWTARSSGLMSSGSCRR